MKRMVIGSLSAVITASLCATESSEPAGFARMTPSETIRNLTEAPQEPITFERREGPPGAQLYGPSEVWRTQHPLALWMRFPWNALPKIELWLHGGFIEMAPSPAAGTTPGKAGTYSFPFVPHKLRFTSPDGQQAVWTVTRRFVTGEASVEHLRPPQAARHPKPKTNAKPPAKPVN